MTYPKYEPMTREQWRKTIAHDHGNPVRTVAYGLIGDHLSQHTTVKHLTEIGFCSCYDFETQFKSWHDSGKIRYVGYDCWKPFVEYARAEFPDYDWRHGSAEDMSFCDISYAKHVFMTMAPEAMPIVLTGMLRATSELCVVVWHYPPQYESKHYVRHTDGGRDVWTNRYERKQVETIYESEGFEIEMVDVEKEAIYVARRRDA